MKRLSVEVEPLRAGREVALRHVQAQLEAGEAGFALSQWLAGWLDAELAGVREVLTALGVAVPHRMYATGSYGRQRICPRSDVDLLVVYGEGLEEEALSAFCGGFQTVLRDVGFKVGMAVRTVSECLSLSQEDQTIAASMMDARLLWRTGGAADLGFDEHRLGHEVARVLRKDDGGRAFAQALREGMRQRHKLAGQTVYWLEPNLKQGYGGVRDLNGLEWTALALWGVRDLSTIAELVGVGERAVEQVQVAADFVLRTRIALHLLAGRFANDRLTFEYQEKIAALFGYEGEEERAVESRASEGRGLLAVERFMQEFYRNAERLAQWSRTLQDIWLLPATEELPVRVEPGICVRDGSVDVTRAQDRFSDGPLVLHVVEHAPSSGSRRAHEPQAVESPSASGRALLRRNPVRLFEAALELGLPVHPQAVVLLFPHAGEAEELWSTPDVALSLRRVLCALEAPDELIRSLGELSMVVRVMPEFEPVTALAQHDVYHVYTVDAHLRRALRYGKELLRGEGADWEEVFGRIGKGIPSYRHEVVLLACLLHDVGKGRGGNHSLIGAELVKEIGARLCLTELQTSHLAFLVEHHLLLPKVSQRRDLTDEETIASVARMVRTRQALDDLALLAVADMKAVGPKNFTPWKAHLLAELYHRVRHALETGGSAWRTAAARGEVQASVSSLLAQVDLAGLVVDAARVERFVASMPLRYLLATPPDALLRHLLASVRGEGDAVHVEFHTAASAAYTELIVCTRDRPGTLVTISGVLAAHDVNILAAEINADAEGRTLDVFAIQSSGGTPLGDGRRVAALEAGLREALRGEVSEAELVVRRQSRGLPPRPGPEVLTVVAVDQSTSSRYTIIEVRSRDRVGLLWTISRTLFQMGNNITLSKINTEGDRVIDVFYVERMDEARKLTDAEAQAVRVGLQAVLDGIEGEVGDADR